MITTTTLIDLDFYVAGQIQETNDTNAPQLGSKFALRVVHSHKYSLYALTRDLRRR